MTANSQSITATTVTAHTVGRAVAERGAVSRALAPIARRAMPLVTASLGTAIATLAAERAIAGMAMRAAERTGLVRAHPVEDGVTRVIVTHTTVVERITRR